MANAKAWMKIGVALLVAAALLAGCETGSEDNEGTITLGELQGQTPVVPNTNTNVAPTPDPENPTPEPEDPEDPGTGTNAPSSSWPSEITGSIRWLHTDVSSWPVTASLTASVGGSTINFPYSKASVWPVVDGVNANCWVFVKLNGQWYAATFEWLRRGQTAKPKGVLDGSMGDHIKVSPLSSWRPKKGERIGIMVSGLARTQMRSVRERSNVYMVTWP